MVVILTPIVLMVVGIPGYTYTSRIVTVIIPRSAQPGSWLFSKTENGFMESKYKKCFGGDWKPQIIIWEYDLKSTQKYHKSTHNFCMDLPSKCFIPYPESPHDCKSITVSLGFVRCLVEFTGLYT